MDFSIVEHCQAKKALYPRQSVRKPSLFAYQYDARKAGQYVPVSIAEPINEDDKDVAAKPPVVQQEIGIISEFEALICYSYSQNAKARSHAFKALEMGLIYAKQTNKTDVLRLYYSPEYSPLPYALTAIYHDYATSLPALLLISQLLQCEECYIYEILAPFMLPDDCRAGVFHENCAHVTYVLYDLLNSFSDTDRDVVFLILERLEPSNAQIVRLFENELTLYFEAMRKGAFLTTAGRVSLRNSHISNVDQSILSLLLCNFDFSFQGAEILRVVVLLLRHYLHDAQEEPVRLCGQFIKDQVITDEYENRDCQELLCYLAYMLNVEIAFDDKFRAYLAHEYTKTLVNFPFVAWYIGKTVDETIKKVALLDAIYQFNAIPINLLYRNEWFESQAPQIQFNDAGIRKIYFAWLFRNELAYYNVKLVDSMLSPPYSFLLAQGFVTLRYISDKFAFEFEKGCDVLDRYEQYGYVGIFMLTEELRQKHIDSVILPFLTNTAQDIAFLLAYFIVCEEYRKYTAPGFFKLLEKAQLKEIQYEEVRINTSKWQRFYSWFLEFGAKVLRMYAFIAAEDVYRIIKFANVDNIEVNRLLTQMKQFYRVC